MISIDELFSSKSLYLAIVARPPPETNYCANYLDDSALNTNLDIKLIAIEMFSLLTYLRELRVK